MQHVKLVVFDLDGTLLDTNSIDSECFVQAWSEVGVDCSAADWSGFEHVTDHGIARELLARHGIRNHEETLRRVRQRFIALLAESAETNPGAFSAVTGVPELLRRLPEFEWAVVIATGAWAASADLKIRAASLPPLPVASSDDHWSRERIVERALDLAAQQNHGQSFSRIILVGDASWDLEAARKLSLPFVGVASSEQRELLMACGASHVLQDFASLETVIAAFESATVPR